MRKMYALLAVLPLAGCQALHDGLSAAEGAIKAPPTDLVNVFQETLHLGGDFLLSILNMALHAVISGGIGSFLAALGI